MSAYRPLVLNGVEIDWMNAMKETDEKEKRELGASAGSVVFPSEDGWYWMRNLVGDDRDPRWRVVRVFKSLDYGRGRVARDGASLYAPDDLKDWKGIEFHGPLHPPNDKLSYGGD